MSLLESDYAQRAAPPGSMRYFSLLYTPREQRELVMSLFVIDAEVRASIDAPHEVAHTRLQWWRAEIDRLINRNAQHPATQALQRSLPASDFSVLHEFLVSADMDLARMTYNSAAELHVYLERSGGTLLSLLTDDTALARRIGALVRRTETLRDLAMDARAGRIYWSLDDLEQRGIPLDSLRGPATPALKAIVADEIARWQQADDSTTGAPRPLAVLAALHIKLLDRMRRSADDVFSTRHELGPLEKVWTAWRAARRS